MHFQDVMCDNCTNRKELCILGSRVACQICNHRKVQCSFLDRRRKRKNEEIDSKDEEPTPKKAKVGGSKPVGSKPTVVILGPSRVADVQPTTETVELLRELVSGVRDFTKVTRGLSGLGIQIYQQNTKLIRLGERQSYLAGKAMKKGSGSGSETEAEGMENEEAKKDMGKGKMTEGNDETLKDDGSLDSGEEEEERDLRMDG
jgi:hypothetical protein